MTRYRRVVVGHDQTSGVAARSRLRDRERPTRTGRPATQPMPTTQTAVPWRIYLLIDSSTGPTNHPFGTIFYVGNRQDLPEPVDLREVTEAQSLPEEEVAARERLERLNREGIRVIVEVVPEQWQDVARPPGLPRVVGTLCATLHPAPLNERYQSVRWPGSLAQTVERPERVTLPESGAIVRSHQGSVPVATLPLLNPDELFEKHVEFVQGHASPRRVSNELTDGGPLPLFLVTEGRRERGVIQGDFVLGVWMIRSIEPLNEERTAWRVVRDHDPETEGALRRRYLHHLVQTGDALLLRKA